MKNKRKSFRLILFFILSENLRVIYGLKYSRIVLLDAENTQQTDIRVRV